MEEYLQNMKALRFQMNDVEDQAAMTSVEEQTLLTSTHAMETDIESAKSKTRSLKEETELMLKAKNGICAQILDKHKKMTSLEAESSSLSQTLELIQQEKLSLSSKIQEKRTCYTKVKLDLLAKLQGQQDWINSRNLKVEVEGKIDENNDKVKGLVPKHLVSGGSTGQIHSITECLDFETNTKYKAVMATLAASRAKLAEIKESNSKLVSDSSKMEESVKQLQRTINDFPPGLRSTDMNALEEEHKALLSDKAGEMEYLQTLQCQVEQLKGISDFIKCGCGEEYKVEMAPTCS